VTSRTIAFLASTLLLSACNPAVREWTPSDHDRDPGSPAQAPSAARGNPAEAQAQLVEVAWSRQCASCHGPEGRGDGPQGPMAGARDLTAAAFQSATPDEQMIRSIRGGKGRMPAFADLPEPIVTGLVRRIRRAGGR
jgi:mono/diheme cytochrome c family protein